jgi:hypothetical protein
MACTIRATRILCYKCAYVTQPPSWWSVRGGWKGLSSRAHCRRGTWHEHVSILMNASRRGMGNAIMVQTSNGSTHKHARSNATNLNPQRQTTFVYVWPFACASVPFDGAACSDCSSAGFKDFMGAGFKILAASIRPAWGFSSRPKPGRSRVLTSR